MNTPVRYLTGVFPFVFVNFEPVPDYSAILEPVNTLVRDPVVRGSTLIDKSPVKNQKEGGIRGEHGSRPEIASAEPATRLPQKSARFRFLTILRDGSK